MRIFPRDEKNEMPVMPVSPDPSVDPVLVQAVDTVARRLVTLRGTVAYAALTWSDFADIGEADWERIEARAAQLLKELDRGQGPFDAAYKLLKARAET